MCDARAGPLVGEAIHLDALVVIERSLRDLNIFAGAHPPFVLLRGILNFFCRAHIVTYCPDLCWGVYVMLVQGLWWVKPSTLKQ